MAVIYVDRWYMAETQCDSAFHRLKREGSCICGHGRLRHDHSIPGLGACDKPGCECTRFALDILGVTHPCWICGERKPVDDLDEDGICGDLRCRAGAQSRMRLDED